MFVLLLARMVAQLHRLFINSMLTCWSKGDTGLTIKFYIDVTESQLVLNHLHRDVVLVGKGGHCAEHLTCRNRIRRVFT